MDVDAIVPFDDRRDAAGERADGDLVDSDDVGSADESDGDATTAVEGGIHCTTDDECPPPALPVFAEHGQCVDHRCEECNPDDDRVCGRGSHGFVLPICARSASGAIACKACESDQECSDHGKGSVCAGQCSDCREGQSFEASGCDITSSAPVCARFFQTGGGPVRCSGCTSNYDAPAPGAFPLYSCGASRPICLPLGSAKGGHCVECVEDADCHDLAKPRCDTANNACVL